MLLIHVLSMSVPILSMYFDLFLGIQYLSRFMRVSRFLVTVAFCFLLLVGVGCMSFCLAVLAIKLLHVGSAFLGCVAFLVASVASFYASALVSFSKSVVGIDHHDSCVGGSSSLLVCLSHILESLPSEFVGFNLTKPLGELRICAHL